MYSSTEGFQSLSREGTTNRAVQSHPSWDDSTPKSSVIIQYCLGKKFKTMSSACNVIMPMSV